MLELIGIDPGIRNSGLVYIQLHPKEKAFTTGAYAYDGAPVDLISQKVLDFAPAPVFIEDYRSRSAYSTDKWMIATLALLRKEIPKAKFVPNMGVKRIVTRSLLEALGLWAFDITTHHQDIRSAARIGLLAGLKDEEFNRTLATLIADHVDGKPWKGKKIWVARG